MEKKKKSSKILVSIILPCYNEEENLKRGALKEVASYLKGKKFSWEVIISDDGSSDNSLDLVKKFAKGKKGFRVLENKHGGKPWAVWQGIKAAKGEWVLFADVDQSTPIKELDKLLPWTEKGYDAVIGSRGIKRKNFPLVRKIGAVVFLSFRKLFFLSQINDTQCGFKLFKRKLVREIFENLEALKGKASGWTVTSYDVELLFMVDKKGAQIKEVVVRWEDRDKSTTKNKAGGYLQRYFKESKDMVAQILKVKLNDWQGKYRHLAE